VPLQRRRWSLFCQNRRGFWSLWLFLLLFGISLFSDVIANDRPLFVSYKGEWLFPVFADYPEEKFGGFLAHTDYRDPVIINEIAAHGWALWPPIRFSYQTPFYDVPTPAPSPPTWMLTQAQCRAAVERKLGKPAPQASCWDLEWNWLGTDANARDVLARLL